MRAPVKPGTQNVQTRRRIPLSDWIVLPVAAAALTATAYLLWLGWHQLENKSAYEPWQVVGLALTLGLLVIVPTWRSTSLGLFSTAVVTVSLTLIWSWDAATTPAKDASLWPIGAVLLFAGAVAGLTVTWGLTELVKTLMVRRLTRRG